MAGMSLHSHEREHFVGFAEDGLRQRTCSSFLFEMLRAMNLRPFVYPAVLLFGTALIASPAFGQASSTSTPAQQSPYGGTIVEEIVARVNDQIITRSDYNRAIQQLETDARQQGISPQDVESRKKDLLRDLVDQQLLLSKGKSLGITGQTELIKRLDDIRKQYHLETMEDLERAAKEQGVSYEDFKAKIQNDIITQRVVQEEVGRRLQVTPGEIQRFYAAHKSEFNRPESIRLGEILVSTGSAAPSATEKGATVDDPEKLAKAKAKAEDIEAKLKAGQAFETLARSYSDGQTAAQGGDLGNFKRGMLAKELEDKTFSLKAGEFTEPIRTKQGYIILKVSQHIPGGIPELKDIQPEVEETLYLQRMQPALRQFLTTLREQAYLDIKPGYVDSGASVKQTKPVFSAYVPPAPKKKKKVQRVRFREKTKTVRAPRSKDALDVPALPSAPASSTTAAATTEPASGAATPATTATQPQTTPKTTSSVAKNTQAPTAGTMKPGKREKIRFGQAPRETLPKGKGTKTEDAGAIDSPAVASADAEKEPVNPLEPQAEAQKKTRFSQRAKVPKEKKQKGPKVDPFAPPPPDAASVADTQTQAAPLGLNGDTATKKKQKKQKAETGQKTRYSDAAKEKDKEKKDQQQQTPAPSAPTPAPAASTPSAPTPQQ